MRGSPVFVPTDALTCMQFDEESNEDVRKLCRYLHRNSMPCIIHAHVFGDDLQTEWNCIIGTERQG